MERPVGVMWGYETALAVLLGLVISSLSVCAAVLIYRAVKGQRGKSSRHDAQQTHDEGQTQEAEDDEDDYEDDDDDLSKSTGSDIGDSEEAEADSSDSIILSEAKHRQRDLQQEDLSKLNLDEPTINHPDIETHELQCGQGDALEKGVNEDLHIDTDEPSETESAQERMESKNILTFTSQSMEDLSDNSLSSQEFGNRPNKEEGVVETATVSSTESKEDMKTSDKELGNGVQQLQMDESCKSKDIKDQDLCTLGKPNESVTPQQHTDNKSSNISTSPCQTYCEFVTADQRGASSALTQIPNVSGGKEVVAHEVNKNNEINIMEAIMDSNEWLSSGPPDTRDMPWLYPNHNSYGFTTDKSSSVVSNEGSLKKQQSQGKSEDSVEYVVGGVTGNQDHVVTEKKGGPTETVQLVCVSFRVHYITHSSTQILGVTGNQEELGVWKSFVPLISSDDGFWFGTIQLPLDRQVEWKFVVVEDGEICRWEECGNRNFMVTGQEQEIKLEKNWGCA